MNGQIHSRILCVCLGNICRSPAAEGVLQHRISTRGLTKQIHVDSAGTQSYHVGELADPRMRRAASARGYNLTSRARHFVPSDLDTFHLVLAMDRSNLQHIQRAAQTAAQRDRVRLFSAFLPPGAREDVPDPYYGGAQGFEEVLDMLEAGADAVIDSLIIKPIDQTEDVTC